MEQLGVTRGLNVVGAVFSTSSSVAKLPRVVARTPLTSGRTRGTSYRMSRLLTSVCVWRFMRTPLMRTRFERTACPGSSILSPPCRAVPAPGLMLHYCLCSVVSAFVLFVRASVVDDAMPAAYVCLISGLVRRSLSASPVVQLSRILLSSLSTNLCLV
jgi:hypothetical protein